MIFHPVLWQEAVLREVAVQIDCLLKGLLAAVAEVYLQVVALRIGMVVVRVADHKGAVCVGVVDVVGACLSRPGVGMILRAVPVDAIYSHGCHVGREDLKLAIFVARPEEVVAAVAPPQSVGHRILRASIPAGVVPALILEHHGGDLPLWVRHPIASIAHLHLHLLVVLVDGCVRIGQHL